MVAARNPLGRTDVVSRQHGRRLLRRQVEQDAVHIANLAAAAPIRQSRGDRQIAAGRKVRDRQRHGGAVEGQAISQRLLGWPTPTLIVGVGAERGQHLQVSWREPRVEYRARSEDGKPGTAQRAASAFVCFTGNGTRSATGVLTSVRVGAQSRRPVLRPSLRRPMLVTQPARSIKVRIG